MECGNYPLYIQDEKRGEVQVYREGLYTVIDAAAEGVARPVELWVYGDSESASVGRLIPVSGEAHLTKRLSRSEMSRLPERAEYFCDREREKKAPPRSQPVWTAHPDGTLTRQDGQGTLVAIPAQLRRRVSGIRLETVNGREYIVFRY